VRRPLVAGNWKMNGSLDSIRELLREINQDIDKIDNIDVAVFPSFVYLAETQHLLTGSAVKWGAQTVCSSQSGAFTGEVSASMLKDFSCTYVLVGHSERRTLYAEHDDIVVKKWELTQTAGLIPILCVGESLLEREQNITEEVIARQLAAVMDAVDAGAIEHSVIAYEPVWAIGTGKTATPQQAQDVHAFIRSKIAKHNAKIADSVRILYGGSVNASNAQALFSMPDIDGGLIGGASLQAQEFLSIAKTAMQMQCN
jgi:triosephosphate isomerase